MPAIDYLMSQLNLAPTAIDRFVVAEGPGSYTGLRLGVTTAKTLAYTLKKELVGISSLQTLVANCVGQTGLVVPLLMRVVKRLCWCLSVCQWRVAK